MMTFVNINKNTSSEKNIKKGEILCTILGCGGSKGVPQIGCTCDNCTSSCNIDKRTCSSILIESDTTTVLIDTSPDIRYQAINNNITGLDAVLYTHMHYDHTAGIGHLEQFKCRYEKMPIFMDAYTAHALVEMFGYLFHNTSQIHSSTLESHVFWGSFTIGNITVTPFLQQHGSSYHSCGFRFGDFVYSTDINGFDEHARFTLKGTKIWVLDCLRYYFSQGHNSLEDILRWNYIFNPDQIILTHMEHTLASRELRKLLPSNIVPGYDGMQIRFPISKIIN